jgi:murein DD-endopeptidase MepM/ murein hydrolase activator NlpD
LQFGRIYSIINNGREKNQWGKGVCLFILSKKFKYYTKETFKIFSIIFIGLIFIVAIICMKYKPTYIVSVSGEKLGYIESKTDFEDAIQENIIEYSGKNVDSVCLNSEPKYELKLVDRSETTNEEEIIATLQKDTTITYKYYEVALNDEQKTYVDTKEDAENLVNEIQEKYSNEDVELNFEVSEIKTENAEEIKTEDVETAKVSLEPEIEEIVESETAIAVINSIKLSVLPVSGQISSRFGVSSSIRSSTHTGLDIACSQGTPVKAVADGTVTFAEYKGSYGNLVKISHGNGVETWYAHNSAIKVKVGQEVKAGDIVSAVGSTGNSTGPHLHLEIRINGTAVNPQNYLYN